MKFTTVAEVFNHYRTADLTAIETRAKEIAFTIDSDPTADVDTLNMELDGLKQAKENIEQRATTPTIFNPITSANFGGGMSAQAINGDILSSPEYRTAFFKTLLGQKLNPTEDGIYKRALTEHRADSFNTLTNSASVLPTTTLNEVIKKAGTIGGLLPECRQFNIPTKLSVPIGTPTAKANWHAEGTAVERESTPAAKVDFSAYEILKVFSMSAAAKRMSIGAFENYIIDELNSSIMETLADAVINGTGEAQGTGILQGVARTNKNSFTAKTISYTDLLKVVSALARGYANGAKWAMNNATLYNSFYGLLDGNGRPLFITDPKNESIGKILGFDVVVDDNLDNDTVLFGNYRYMGYNIPEGIVIETSTESGFTSGLIDYRTLAIADCKPLIDEAFIKLTITA